MDYPHVSFSGLILFMALFVVLYYALNIGNPLGMAISAPEINFGQILFFLLCITGAFFIGRATLLAFGERNGDRMVFTASMLIGLGIIGFMGMLLGMGSDFRLIVPVVAVLSVAGFILMAGNYSMVIEEAKPFLVPVLLIIIIASLLASALPIMSLDAMYYHAEMSRILFLENAFPEIRGTGIGLGISSNYPPLSPSLGAFFILGSPSFDDFNLRLGFFFIAILCAIPVFLLSKKLFPEKGLGAILFFSWTFSNLLIITDVQSCYPLLFAFFAASFYYWQCFLETKGRGKLIISAVLFGFSLLCSYVALGLLPMFAIFWVLRGKPDERKLVDLLLFLFIAAVVFCPWAARNYIITGDPIYPFISSLFEGPDSPISLTLWHLKIDTGGENIPARMVLLFLMYPFIVLALIVSAIRIYEALRPGERKRTELAALLSDSYFVWFWYSFLALLGSVYFVRYAVMFLIPAGYVTIGYFISLKRESIIFSTFLILVAALAIQAFLATFYIGSCLFCGYTLFSEAYHYTGHGEFFEFANSVDGKIAAFDMPTYYLAEGRSRIIPIDEGYVFAGLREKNSNQKQACYLEGLGSEYVLLLENASEKKPFTYIQLFQNLTNPRIELVKKFGETKENQSYMAVYRIVGCGQDAPGQ